MVSVPRYLRPRPTRVLRESQYRYLVWPARSPEDKTIVYASSLQNAKIQLAIAWNTREIVHPRPGIERYIDQSEIEGISYPKQEVL